MTTPDKFGADACGCPVCQYVASVEAESTAGDPTPINEVTAALDALDATVREFGELLDMARAEAGKDPRALLLSRLIDLGKEIGVSALDAALANERCESESPIP